jgi:small subunit ribosomal protein S6
VLALFEGPSTVVAEFERRLRIDEKVIKYQTVLLEGPTAVAPAAAEPAKEEAAPAAVEAPAGEA